MLLLFPFLFLYHQVKKQATIFGACCADRAQLGREEQQRGIYTTLDDDEKMSFFWDDEDFDNELGFDMVGFKENLARKPVRVFKCWYEPWEVDLVHHKHPTASAKLLQKYGGMSILDIDDTDTTKKLTIHATKLGWYPKRRAKVPWGWTLLCFPEGYVPVEPDPMDDEEVEPWAIDDDAGIYDCVREFHKRYPDPTVDIQLNGKEDSNDNDNGN